MSFNNDGIMNHNFILLMLLGPILAQKEPDFGQVLAHQQVPKCPQWSLRELVQISPLIVEASVISHGDVDPKTDTFQVTFKIKKVFKSNQGTV